MIRNLLSNQNNERDSQDPLDASGESHQHDAQQQHHQDPQRQPFVETQGDRIRSAATTGAAAATPIKEAPDGTSKMSASTTAATSSTTASSTTASSTTASSSSFSSTSSTASGKLSAASSANAEEAEGDAAKAQGMVDDDYLRPGSPIPHRQQRGTAPPAPPLLALDRDTPPGVVTHAAACDNERSPVRKESNANAQKIVSEGSEGVSTQPPASRDRRPHPLSKSKSFSESALELRTSRTASESDKESGPRSPAPVTLLGVDGDLRRKRIKKVSNYILGPLLGEGSYGVVRDALDLSGEHVTRCAVKMVTGVGKSHADRSEDVSRAPRESGAVLVGGPGTADPPAHPTGDGNHDNDDSCEQAQLPDDVNTSGSAGPALHVGARDLCPTTAVGGTGLRRCTRKSFASQAFEQERTNLQRFHNKHIIRAMDVFSRMGKQYVVLPIALCSLAQLVAETQERGRASTEAERQAASATTTNASTLPPKPLTKAAPPSSSAARQGGAQPAVSIIADGESFPDGEDDDHDSMNMLAQSSTSSSTRTSHTIDSFGDPAPFGQETRALPPLPAPALPMPLLPPMLIKGIMFQLLSGLAYLHKQNLAHNDVKPSNVLLFESGTVKLTDLGGISEHFTDKGTPMYAAPELCRSFFLMNGEEDSSNSGGSNADHHDTQVDAKACDMWCAGLVLYYLITGKTGPLPIHAILDASHELAKASAAAPFQSRFQVYRELAAQKTPVDLDALPDLIVDAAAKGGPTTADLVAQTTAREPSTSPVTATVPPKAAFETSARGEDTSAAAAKQPLGGASSSSHTPTSALPDPASAYPANSVRHLLARMLDLDPARRITAAEALTHPWVTLTFKPSDKNKQKQKKSPTTNANKPDKQPSRTAMEEAIQRDVAKRVLQSPIVQHMNKKDKERHLQFVCDAANVLHIDIPPEVLKPRATEPFDGEDGEDGLFDAGRASYAQSTLRQRERETGERSPFAPLGDERRTRMSSGSSFPRGSSGNLARLGTPVVEGTVVSAYLPSRMPPGCVDTNLFLPPHEEDYYAGKSGGAHGFDVAAFRHNPVKVRALKEYLYNTVLVQCGYRTGADPIHSLHSISRELNSLLTLPTSHNTGGSNDAAAASSGSGNAGGGGSNGSGNNTNPNGDSNPNGANGSGSNAGAAGANSNYGNGPHGATGATNASAIMGSVVIQTNRKNSLQGRRGFSSTRLSSLDRDAAAVPARGGNQTPRDDSSSARRTGSRRAGGANRRGVYEGAAGEKDVAMRESSKCFCGLV